MNLPNYIDLDSEYFIALAEKLQKEAQPLTGRELDKFIFDWSLSYWEETRKFYSQKVELGMFVPCSECSECGGLGFVHAGDSDDDIKCPSCEQSGKPLEKPENYSVRDTGAWKGAKGHSQWQLDCKQYHEAEQRCLFTGWEVDKDMVCGVKNKDGALIWSLENGDMFIRYQKKLTYLDEEQQTLSDLNTITPFPLPLNESNKTIQKLFLSEVKV